MSKPYRLLDKPTRTGQQVGVLLTHYLPASMCREIGRIVIKYATLEYMLSQTIYCLLGIDRQSGRIAVREPRAADRLDIIYQLAEERGITITADRNDLRKQVQEAQLARDTLAHGVWILHVEGYRKYLIAKTKGSWVPSGNTKINRASYPQGQEVSTADLRQVWLSITAILHSIQGILDEIVAFQPPSLDTPMKRSHPSGRLPNPVAGAQKRPPKPSRK